MLFELLHTIIIIGQSASSSPSVWVLGRRIRRLPSGKGKSVPPIESEPDFYGLARFFPLPHRAKSEGLTLSEEKPGEYAKLARFKCREKQQPATAKKNETAECLRSPPTALRNVKSKPPGILKHPREISKSKNMNLLEQAKADADIAFARGYVPDYHVLINSFPGTAEKRMPAQMQVQMRFCRKSGWNTHAPPHSLGWRTTAC